MKNNTTKAPLILATLNADGDEIPFRRGASPVTSNVTQQTTIVATLDEHGNPVPISMSDIDDFTTEDKAKLDKLGEDEDGNPTWDGKPICDSQIIVDTFNDLPTDKIPGTEARVLTSVFNPFTGVVTSLEEGDILDAVEISETMDLVGNPTEFPEGLYLTKVGSDGEDSYAYNMHLYKIGNHLIFSYTYSVISGGGNTDTTQIFVYSPEAFIGTGNFEGVEVSAGWNIVDVEPLSASSVLFSEVPLIENNVTVSDVGDEAVLVYPYLQITMPELKPEGRYILNSSNTWVLLDYASRQLVDTKVDKVKGMGLSTNDFSNEYKNMLDGHYLIRSVLDIDRLPDDDWGTRFIFVEGYSDPSTRGLYFYRNTEDGGEWRSLASLDEIYTIAPGSNTIANSFEVVEGTLYESVITGGFFSYDTEKYVYSIKPVPSAANTDLYFAHRMYLRRITETDAYVGCEGDPGVDAAVQLIIMRQLRKDPYA